jgi:hypothetical protein
MLIFKVLVAVSCGSISLTFLPQPQKDFYRALKKKTKKQNSIMV